MQGVFAVAMTVMASAAQMLVNLGLVHRDRHRGAYWDDWLTWMPSTRAGASSAGTSGTRA
jgi:hypothetical protein